MSAPNTNSLFRKRAASPSEDATCVPDAKKQLVTGSCTDLNIHAHDTDTCETSRPNKAPTRTYAMLLMYSGWGYYGMQRNSVFPTIEGELLKALFSLGYAVGTDGEAMGKLRFQRASKTDKSVSAMGQVCSLQLPNEENMMEKINAALPANIRVVDLFRVTRNFSANASCCHREYEYLLPTFAWAPHDMPGGESGHWRYRISAGRLTFANQILHHFVGTHNFYNFTSGRAATDRSCSRYIMSVECGDPFLEGERQFSVISVIGQSFMLHQIRKMIGLAIAIVRGHTSEEVFDIAFGKERVDIPKAPSLGLLLNRVVYTHYNTKFGNDGIHTPIDWSKYEDTLAEFKRHHIYDHIIRQEVETKSMFEWLSGLSRHTYHFRPSGAPQLTPPQTPEQQTPPSLQLPLTQQVFENSAETPPVCISGTEKCPSSIEI